MNIKVKTALILLLTFTIGIIIGALLNRALLENRIRRTITWRNPGGMINRYRRVIQPGSDQSKLIKNILDKLSQENWSDADCFTAFSDVVSDLENAFQAGTKPLAGYLKSIADELEIG